MSNLYLIPKQMSTQNWNMVGGVGAKAGWGWRSWVRRSSNLFLVMPMAEHVKNVEGVAGLKRKWIVRVNFVLLREAKVRFSQAAPQEQPDKVWLFNSPLSWVFWPANECFAHCLLVKIIFSGHFLFLPWLSPYCCTEPTWMKLNTYKIFPWQN